MILSLSLVRRLRPVPRQRGALGRWLADVDSLHRQRVHLARLDDRLLRDVGLTPGDVARELARPYSAASW